VCVSDPIEFVRTLTLHVRRDRAREREPEKERVIEGERERVIEGERERAREREKERERECVTIIFRR